MNNIRRLCLTIRDNCADLEHRRALAECILKEDLLAPDITEILGKLGKIKTAADADRAILDALMRRPVFFETAYRMPDEDQIALFSKLIKLSAFASLRPRNNNSVGQRLLWQRFITYLSFETDEERYTDELANATILNARYLRRFLVRSHLQTRASPPRPFLDALIAFCNATKLVPEFDVSLGPPQWWTVNEEEPTPSSCTSPMCYFLTVLARWMYREPWPLEHFALDNASAAKVLCHYSQLRQSLGGELRALELGFRACEAFQETIRPVVNHRQLQEVANSVAYSRGVLQAKVATSRRIIETMDVDFGRLFQKIWQDAALMIVALQQSALGVIGATLPPYVVLDLIRINKEGAVGLVRNEQRLLDLINRCTARANALRTKHLESVKRRH